MHRKAAGEVIVQPSGGDEEGGDHVIVTWCGEARAAAVYTRPESSDGDGQQHLGYDGMLWCGLSGYRRNDPIREGSRTDPGKAPLKLVRSVEKR